jgi:hypothetical protein
MSRLLVLGLFAPLLTAGTTVLFDPASPSTGPFPTDALTVPDLLQKTGLHLNLPLPPCASEYTSCQEVGLLEQLDGFSLRAAITVRFSGPVDLASLPNGIFFVALDNLTQEEPGIQKTGDAMGIDQAVYDPATNTLRAKPFSVLDQHRRYVLVATDAVRDTAGSPVGADAAYAACLKSPDTYCAALAQAVAAAAAAVAPRRIVAASVFTTMSATAWLEHARAILQFVDPAPRVTSPAISIPALSGLVLHEQTGVNPARFSDLALPATSALLSGLGTLVVGAYRSPKFLEGDQTIPPYPTLPDLPVPAETNTIGFNALLPAAPKPAGGYPVVIFGHGFGDSRWGGPTAVAPSLARAGFATIAINAVGHGFGPLSSVTFVDNRGNATTVGAAGRGVDVNGDGIIEAEEGCTLETPVGYGVRDCFRQTVVDLLQLARAIRQGIDLDGDGRPDLDGSRIYYAGQSLGALYGSMLAALDPSVRAAALNVGAATVADIALWSPAYRSLANRVLALRVPPLLNAGSTYNADYVLQGQPVHVISVPGAAAIQEEFFRLEWLQMPGDPIAFLPHLQISPLAGLTARPVLAQFARADMTLPNPMNSMFLRAGGLESSVWEYRHDLARPLAPSLPRNPHPFLVLFVSLDGSTVQLPGLAGLSISLDAQQQIAGFFAADGASIPDPNNLSQAVLGRKVFEIPVALPWDFGF